MEDSDWYEASEVAEKLIDKYYAQMDKNRSSILLFFTSTGSLSWNGHQIAAPDIQKFYDGLPGSKTQILSVSAQPISQIVSPEFKSVAIFTVGKVNYDNQSKSKIFNENLIVMKDNSDGLWKIISSTFRFMSES